MTNSTSLRKGRIREVRRWLHSDVLETSEPDAGLTIEFYRRRWLGGIIVTRVNYDPEGEVTRGAAVDDNLG